MKTYLAALILCIAMTCPAYASDKSAKADAIERFRTMAQHAQESGDLNRALQCWYSVLTIEPKNQDALNKADELLRTIEESAKTHFEQGALEEKSGNQLKARDEYLRTLYYKPEHAKALAALTKSVTELDSFMDYALAQGDTPKSIAKKVYGDEAYEPVVQYFADSSSSAIKLPIMSIPEKQEETPAAPPVVASAKTPDKTDKSKAQPKPDKLSEATALFKDGRYMDALQAVRSILEKEPSHPGALGLIKKMVDQAEVHYKKGVGMFINEKLLDAVREWDVTLLLNPNHGRAMKSRESALRLMEKLKAK